MKRKSRLVTLAAVIALLSIVTLACSQTPEPTLPPATSTPNPTQVPTATATTIPTATLVPTATSIPTVTSVPTATVAIPATATLPAPTATPFPSPTATPEPTVAPPTVLPTATIAPTATAAPSPTVAAIPQPRPIDGQRGGKLRFAIPSAPPHQDVHESVSPILASWGPGIVYSRIFRHQWNNPEPRIGLDSLSAGFDSSAASFAGDILCDICASWSMDDADSLTVELRQDVQWQDLDPLRGRQLVASDVVFSLNRLRDPAFQNSDLLNTIETVSEVDESTVRIETSIPDAELFEKLADAHAAIVAPEAVANNGNLRSGPTVGSGPWILGRFEPLLMTFSANLDYFVPVLPLTFSIEASVVAELSTRVVMIQVDASDFVQIDLESLRQAAERDPGVLWTTEYDAAAGVEVAFNTTSPKLNDVQVRRAILKSWNPGALIDQLHGGMSFVTAGLPLRQPDWLLPDDEVMTYFNNADDASELLQPVTEPSGQVTIKVGAYGDAYTQAALYVAQALRAVGFIPTIQSVSTRDFADDVWIRGNYEVYVGAPPPQSSTTSMLFSVHHSQGPWNSTGFASSALDDLIARQTIELDPAARREYLLDIQRHIFDGAYRLIAATNVSIWTWSPKVQNFAPNSFRGDSHWLSRIWMLE